MCTLCGDCCTGAQTIFLTPMDWTGLARFTGLANLAGLREAALVKLGWQAISPSRSILRPQIRFLRRPVVQCPFLTNDLSEAGTLRGLCQLHLKAKPLVCRLSPLTRMVETVDNSTQQTWSAIPPVEGCPGMGQGAELLLKAPPNLREHLDHELDSMAGLVAAWAALQDETSAWAYYSGVAVRARASSSKP